MHKLSLLQINHLKSQLDAIETLKRRHKLKRDFAKHENNKNYKAEYDRILFDLSRTNAPHDVKTQLGRRAKVLRQLYDDSEESKKEIFHRLKI